MTQIHNGAFLRLIEAVGIDTLLQIIFRSRVMPEGDFSALPIFQQFKKMEVGIVDHQRRGSCKILVRPGIRQHMHRQTHSLQRSTLCQFHCILHQLTIGLTD